MAGKSEKGSRLAAFVIFVQILGLVGFAAEASATVPVASSASSDGVTIHTATVAVVPGRPVRARFDATGSSVAFTWSGGEASLRYRVAVAGRWTAWSALDAHLDGGEGDGPGASRAGVDPIWTGMGTSAVEVEVVHGDMRSLDIQLFEVAPRPETVLAPRSVQTSAAGVATVAGASDLVIHPLSAWRSPGWSYDNCPSGIHYMDTLEIAVIHHTATKTSYAASEVDDQLRAIHAYHTRTRGWCDIAYNFLVDRFGRVWEGRAGGIFAPVRGGHARGFNTGSVGISLLGDFDANGAPADMMAAAGQVAGWKLSGFGHDPEERIEFESLGSTRWPEGQVVTLDRVTRHRAVSSTSCPGQHAVDAFWRARRAAFVDDPARFTYGRIGDTPVFGDWDGDGVETPGTRRNNVFYLRNNHRSGAAHVTFGYGVNSDLPVVGDWDGDGVSTIGVYRAGTYYLRNSNTTGIAEIELPVGDARDLPVVGDWDGDGVTEVGVMRGNEVRLWNSDGLRAADFIPTVDPEDPPPPDEAVDEEEVEEAAEDVVEPFYEPARAPDWRYRFGRSGDIPIAGDWNDDGVETVGVRRGNVMYTHDRHAGGAAGFAFVVAPGHFPLIGHTDSGLPVPVTTDGRRWKIGTALHPLEILDPSA